MELSKKPYEISLWEDVLVFVYEDKTESEDIVISGHGEVAGQYYKERKICNIGSDVMSSPIRAFNPKMVSNTDGTNTFTFDIHSQYYDEELESFVDNPYIPLLVNERKIKVREGALYVEKWDNNKGDFVLKSNDKVKWYDLIVKNISENSETKTFTYTAKDQHINELSTSGYDLVFDDKLENSTGTLQELADKILEGSEWTAETEGSFNELVEDPLYLIKLASDIVYKEMLSKTDSITLSAGKYIYAFFNDVANKNKTMQFLLLDEGRLAEERDINDDNIIFTAKNCIIENVEYLENKPSFAESEMFALSDYRGRRLVTGVKTIYDDLTGRYVEVYQKEIEKNGEKVITDAYLYSETEYITPTIVQSCVINPDGSSGLEGWEVNRVDGLSFPEMQITAMRFATKTDSESDYGAEWKSCFALREYSNQFYNYGPKYNNNLFQGGITKGAWYAFSFKHGFPQGGAGNLIVNKPSNIEIRIAMAKKEIKDGKVSFGNRAFKNWFAEDNGSVITIQDAADVTRTTIVMQGLDNISQKELEDYVIVFRFVQKKDQWVPEQSDEPITEPPVGEEILYITDIQFFPYFQDKNGQILRPGELGEGIINTTYYSYLPEENQGRSKEEIVFDYYGSDKPKYTASTPDSYIKRRTLRESKSNRYNLLCKLCETFECWMQFETEREENGAILLDENKHPRKKVRFLEYSQLSENSIGFKYGINLKSIIRKIQSEDIATKMFVQNNSNEFAKDGGCSIERSSENPSGENFLLDFRYFIRKRLLNGNWVTKDLYSIENGHLGYFLQLREKNNERDRLIEKSSGLSKALLICDATLQAYKNVLDSLIKQKNELLGKFLDYTGLTIDNWSGDLPQDWKESSTAQGDQKALIDLSHSIEQYTQLVAVAQSNFDTTQNDYTQCDEALKNLANEKKSLHQNFNAKYYRFLQEGSWISEDYVDDTLYYLDGQNTLRAASSPKIEYDINVLELSQVEGYESYEFSLGEKTTMQDVDFFGWQADGITPYKEEVIVTEIITAYDTPDQNKIKVKNYKTKFEDLFQRAEATSQAFEYEKGSYDKASSIVEADGTIKASTLQNSFANNALILQNAKNQSVRWDNTGITTSSPSDPANQVRIVNGGVFLTADGGATWSTGITGHGINANHITTGTIDAGKIQIRNGKQPSFMWNAKGLNAYKWEENQNGNRGYDPGIFIRFDQYGLYGIKNQSEFDATQTEKDADGNILKGVSKIQKYANFSLTWDGFMIKSTERNGGYISITEGNDFEVYNNNKPVIKIGQLNEAGTRFGLRMMDDKGYISLEQDNNGKLWLRDYISIGPVNFTQENYPVQIGYLPIPEAEEGQEPETFHRIFDANNKFVVYEDGSVRAVSGHFIGSISANSGSIGGFTIENGVLYSTENQEASSKENAKIVLDGPTGSLVAKKGFIGGFKIEEERLVSTAFDAVSGKEKIIFDGSKGSIYVKEGTFEGDIIAKNGTIGGFDIRDRFIKSTYTLNGEPILVLCGDGSRESIIGGFRINGDYFYSKEEGIFLKGNEDIITVGKGLNRITLDGKNGRVVLEKQESENTTQAAIVLDAETGSIYSRDYNQGAGLGWFIDGREAIFNNITARGSIKASVFEYGEVQAVGGILLVRPSSRILSQSSTDGITFIFEVESTIGFNAGDVCLITPSPTDKIYFQISQVVESDTGSSIVGNITENYTGFNGEYTGMPIVDLGQPRSEYQVGSIGIGINASTNSSTVSGESISVFEFELKDPDEAGEYYSLNPRIILGKIPELSIYKDLAGSYGLYADNVLLNGSLITKSSEFDGISSGIRTTSYGNAPFSISAHFPAQQGQILIWAGAPTDGASDAENIPKANFYVDQHGQLHAHGAHFSGSVMSEATITASEIKTATIVGTGYNSTDGTAALTIKDAYEGIVFSGFKISGGIKDDEETIFFEVATDKLISRTRLIELQSNVIRASGALWFGRWDTKGFNKVMSISQLGLNWDLKKSGFEYDYTNNSINFKVNNAPVMNLESGKIKVQNSISYQEKIVYSPVKEIIDEEEQVIGYNLYVY